MTMLRIASALVALALGALGGRALEWLRIRPLFCSLGATMLGWALGSLVAAVAWLNSPGESEVLAVSLGLREAAVSSITVALIAGVLHFGLGWAGSAISPYFAVHRGAVLGGVGGIIGAVAFLTAGAMTQPVR